MFEIIAVTNRGFCPGGTSEFLGQIKKIAASGVSAVILREKDLSADEYRSLAKKVSAICAENNVRFIAHNYAYVSAHAGAAVRTGAAMFHLPWSAFSETFFPQTPEWVRTENLRFGVSVHSAEEARLAVEHGASWLIGGHLFATQSKTGLDARGLDFLSEICRDSPVPVFGIGGINGENISDVAKTGAAGACLMSSLMQSPDPAALVEGLLRRVENQIL